jgi:hypothetical protein
MDIDMVLFTNEEQKVWAVFDSMEDAIASAKRIVEEYDHIECTLFDKERKLIRLIQPA